MARSRAATIATLACGLTGMLASTGAGAQDVSAFSPAQRSEIVAIVRQAMKTDPSILRDAVATLRADEQRVEAAGQDGAISSHRAELADGQGDAVAGNSVGDVTVTEFYDPRCPYCKRMLPTIAAAIAADRKLRVVYKIIPILGPQSVIEARAIVAAGEQGGYVRMQDAVMNDPAPMDDAEIARVATSVHLDPVMLARDMKGRAVAARLAANMALARALHVDGTPALVIGGQLVPGAMELPEFQRAIANARG